MRKNKMMRFASALMIATLLSTSVISGTFAKYVTSDTASDTARVAKWGVELQVVGDLYGAKYLNEGSGNIATSGTENLSVQSSNIATENVVAPGTLNNSGFGFKLNGKPEVNGVVTTKIEYENIYLTEGNYGVMVQVPAGAVTAENFASLGKLYKYNSNQYVLAEVGDISGDLYTLEDYVEVAKDYYPVEYTMVGTTTEYNDGYTVALEYDTLKGLVTKLVETIGTSVGADSVEDGKTTNTWTKNFVANEELASILKLEDQKIQWKWDFCNDIGHCEEGDDACDYCKADSILGNLMAGSAETKVVKENGTGTDVYVVPEAAEDVDKNDYNLETSFSIKITVEQVD